MGHDQRPLVLGEPRSDRMFLWPSAKGKRRFAGQPHFEYRVPRPLEQITVGRSHFVAPNHRVNPHYINKLEQTHQIDGSPLAIPFNLDLL